MTDKKFSHGFSLIELMVGMLIAILASIVVYQVFAVSERQKRTTTGASDAQSSGATSIYLMERDIKMAGMGMDTNSLLWKCQAYFSYDKCSVPPDPLDPISPGSEFIPVTITDGGIGPDSISVGFFLDPEDAAANLNFTPASAIRSPMPDPSAELNVMSTQGCVAGGVVIAMRKDNIACTLMEITTVQDSSLKLQHNTGAGTCYNPDTNDITTPHVPAFDAANPLQPGRAWPSYTTDDYIQCMDKPPRMFQHTYRVNNTNLELTRIAPATHAPMTFEIAPQIVDMQAQYGIADAGSQIVNNWVSATGEWTLAELQKDRSKIDRVKAVRLTVLARSSEYEKPDAAGNCASTTDAIVASWPKWADNNPVFDTTNLSGANPDWRCYRYKVFDTTIPLRNIIWANL